MGESKESIGDIVEEAIHDNEQNLREMEEKLKAKLSESGCVTTRERAADDVALRNYDRRRPAEENAERMAYRNYLENQRRLDIAANKDSGEDSGVESDDDEWAGVGPATEAEEDTMRRAEEAERKRKNRLRF